MWEVEKGEKVEEKEVVEINNDDNGSDNNDDGDDGVSSPLPARVAVNNRKQGKKRDAVA